MRSRLLVGRDVELRLLGEAIEGARAGRGSLILLAGEPGIGKSQLAEEAAVRAADAGLTVAWGRCWEAGGAPPFWPWIQVLRALDPDGGVAEGAPQLDRWLPELAGRAGTLESAQDRFTLFDAVARRLAARSARQPLLVVLEDLHAADAPSLLLLSFIAAHLRAAPLALVGTYRTTDARASRELGPLLDALARDAQVIHPRELAADDVAQLVAARALEDADGRLVGWLHRTSEGNPLFLEELLRLVETCPPGTDPADLPVPDGVRAAIRDHLGRLPAGLRPLVEDAAVIGREFPIAVLAAVAGSDGDELIGALAELVARGVLVERAPGRFAFAHGLIGETLHHDLAPARRAEGHLRAAEALERLHAGDPAAPRAEIARHLFAAGPAQVDRAIEHAEHAAVQASAGLAFETAVELLEIALAALATAAPGALARRFELLLALGRVRILAGQDAAGKAACREAAAIARALGSAERLERAAITYGAAFSFGFTDHVLVDLLEEALARLPPEDSPARARLLARLAGALQPAPDPSTPVRVARDAVALARRLGDERTLLETLHFAVTALMTFGPPRERAPLIEEALRLAERLGEPVVALRGRLRLVFTMMELGDSAAVDVHLHAYEELAAQFERPRVLWPARMVRAMRALAQGRLAEHARHVDEARRLARQADDRFFEEVSIRAHEVGVLVTRGDRDGLRAAHDRLLEYLREHASYGPITAVWLAHVIGDRAAAEAAWRSVDVETYIRNADPTPITWAAEIAAYLGDRARAAPLYEWLAGWDGRHAIWTMHGMVYHGSLAGAACLAAETIGRRDDARRHLASARRQLQALGALPHEARLLAAWSERLLAGGDPEDRDEARACLAEARTLVEPLGLELLGWIDELARATAGGAAPASTTAARPVGSTASAGAPPAGTTESAGEVVLERDGDSWVVRGLGARCRVRATRGMELLARLVASPGRELHVLDLVGDGVADEPARVGAVVDAGDAGEAIDEQARASYRARAAELRDDLVEAEAWNDHGRATRARAELEALEAELRRAVGLGGRLRRVGGAAERARVNVQRRITDAIRRIEEAAPALGRHLAATVRTGVYCSYLPERARRPTARR